MPADDFLRWLREEAQARQNSGLDRRRRTVRPLGMGWYDVDGRRLRNFAGNDYLNLAGDPRVLQSAADAMADSGFGARASALVCGRTHWHERLEERLARFEDTESAILFPTGMAANIGTVTALAHRDDVVFCDRLNHASLVDGCRLSGAKLCVYRHDDLDRLRRHLARNSAVRRRLLVTDTVFSMDGDLAPLPDLCDIAEEHDAVLIVDEAHGTGTIGPGGRGVCAHFGIEDRVGVRIGTLSKALGALGGFVAGPRLLIDHLWNAARTQVFSTALPPAVCAAALTALEILAAEPERVHELDRRCGLFRQWLDDAGIPWLARSQGPIVPLMIGDAERTVAIAGRLEDLGFLVGAIRPPTVPRGTSRLRITLSLAHSEDMVRELVQALAAAITAVA